MEYTTYKNFGKAIRLANQEIELIITLEKGPRIIRCAFIDEKNLFTDKLTEGLPVPEGTWFSYGGHRLWIAPEDLPRTYEVDRATTVEEIENGVKIISDIDPYAKMHKEMSIKLDPKANQVEVEHVVVNHNVWNVTCAVWPVSVMNTGGIAIIPFPKYMPHDGNLIPSHTLTLWRYTKMNDPRWTWGEEYVLLKQDDQYEEPQKVGMFSLNGEFGYALDGFFFKKSFEVMEGKVFPDLQSNIEVYTQPGMLEMETLGPLTTLAPKESMSYKETWNLYQGLAQPSTEPEVKKNFDKFFNKK